MEPEFAKLMPNGVSAHAARMYIRAASIEGLKEMEKDLERAVKRLKSVDPTVIAYCCTMGSFYKGKKGDLDLIEKIQGIAGVPATTTSTAVVEALRALNVKSISIITPYTDEINKKEKAFFKELGFNVANIRGMGLVDPAEFKKVHPFEMYQFAKKNFANEADGLFISCTNIATLEIIETLEKDLRKTVVAADQSTIWKTLKKAGVSEAVKGYGKLFTL